MSIPGSMGIGGGPGGGLRFNQTRGRMGNGAAQGVNYPSPFFDIAHTYLPVTIKAMFRWCRYYFLTNPIINATVFKLSEYPITDILIDHPDKRVAARWKEYFIDHLNYKSFQIECGLDYHCFHGDVKAVTEDGVHRLRDLVGRTMNVLSQDGIYRPAKFIESLTEQELLEVEFCDGSTVLATPEHQWPTLTSAGNTKKVPTTELEGKFIPRNVAPRPEQNADYREGVRHGFVFGDGTLYNDGKQARGCFFGEKDKPLLKFFEGHGSPAYVESRGHTFIHGLPAHYKQMPSNGQSASYWYGFLSGFLAADGSVDVAGCVVLTQRSRTVLELIADQLPRLGMVAGAVRGYEESTAYGEGTTYVLSLFKQYMLPQDFLLPHHERNFTENYKPTNYGKRLRVKAVRTTGVFEKVYCCLEEETHTFTIGNGILTGNTYGNCLTSLSFPFKKYLTCAGCQRQMEASRIRPHWVFTNYEFRLSCPHCGSLGTARSKDIYFKNESGIRMMRWSPEDVEVSYSDLTGEHTYFYNIPPGIRNDIIVGKKDAIEQVPEIFIQALRQQKGVVFSKDLFFHLRRPTLADQDRGWGIPLLLPCLKDTFYLQIMKKAQEAILLEHIVPLRILFPQAGSGSSDPYTSINLVDWRDHVATEIARWRMDQNYIPILPLPVGNQTIGGDGRALLMVQEMQAMSEQLINGMQVPLEFIKGGMSYAGTNVSMRMLENQFITYLSRHARMARWTMRLVADYLDWPLADIRFKPFKMADDIQRKAFLFQLNQAGKTSDTTLLADSDLDQEQENQIMERETQSRIQATKQQQLAMAEIQGEQQVIMMKMQAKAQQEMQSALVAPTAPGEPGGPENGAAPPGGQGAGAGGMPTDPMAAMSSQLNAGQNMGMGNDSGAAGSPAAMGGSNILSMAQAIATQLAQQDPATQHLTIKQLRAQSPELCDLVLQYLQSMTAAPLAAATAPGQEQSAAGGDSGLGANGNAAIKIDMRPQPDKLPPRRAAASV